MLDLLPGAIPILLRNLAGCSRNCCLSILSSFALRLITTLLALSDEIISTQYDRKTTLTDAHKRKALTSPSSYPQEKRSTAPAV